MCHRITDVLIPSDPTWKMTDDASAASIRDAALRYVQFGRDKVEGLERCSKQGRVEPSPIVIDLQTDRFLGKKPPIHIPLARFSDLIVVDRDEIEAFRSIQSHIRQYINNRKENKPLNLGLFGPPGSGKSFGVREVAKSIDKDRILIMEFNLAQFSDPKDLAIPFLKIKDQSSDNIVPLAFFDEFDCPLRGENLGWLRYFLAPMQDGKFRHEAEILTTSKAIFVFAGGTSSSFREFSREIGCSEEDRGQFIQAKGPDFVSRLDGKIDTVGINRREGKADNSYVLRRAILIRGWLLKKGLIGRSRRALVSRDFAYKLLTIGEFKHGARSLTKILEMCVSTNGMLHLPPADQLGMHISESDTDKLLA